MALVTKDTRIIDVLEKYPGSCEIFRRLGMGCTECMGATMETLENGARMHGVDLKRLVRALDAYIMQCSEGSIPEH